MAETHDIHDVQKHVRTYLIIFGSLVVLTILTVAVAYVHLPIWPALVVALVIAITKGGLVAGFFMHLKGERPLIKWILILTFVFLAAMFILFISAYHDQVGIAGVAGGSVHVA